MKKIIIKNNLFRFCRLCVKCFTHEYVTYSSIRNLTPAVYIIHHQNMRGPVISMAWFNTPMRPWVLSVFYRFNTCFKHFYNYTFTKRFGIPKVFSAIILFPFSFFVSTLMQSMRAIPVYRGSKTIVKTFKESISALTHGDSLLISPSIDYTDTNSSMGDMYKGFLDLEKYYMKQTGSHLAFVPLHISKGKRCIYVGEAVYFNGENDYNKEKVNVYIRLRKEFLRLESGEDY
jgi:1-acyl-sn-glycerol-3-phosphate acyltransferase